MTLAAWHAEIVELHEFFQGWLGGTLPDNDATFARMVDTMTASFILITPAGVIITGAALSADLRGAHGSRPGWRMWIENAQLRYQEGPLTIATYEEWQQTGTTTTARISTAIFRAQAGTPNGLVWMHVHETWVPNKIDT